MKRLLILFSLVVYTKTQQDVILCNQKFCSNYLENNNCTRGSSYCRVNNATHNGVQFPSPDPCNCCDYCLENLREGDACSTGDIGSFVPSSICGPHLTCDAGICVKISSLTTIFDAPDCSKKQNEYDQNRRDGTLGHLQLRPNCDPDGYYDTYKCIPGLTCFCLDKYGQRIFGEISYTSVASSTMRCGCSRKYHEAIEFLGKKFLHPDQHFRCSDNGDYDAIQCIGEKCMCVDALDGAPTYPTASSVKPSSISNVTLKQCFNPDKHEEGEYFHSCAAKYVEILEEIRLYEQQGYSMVFGFEFPNCTLDGKYGPVQKDSEIAYCAYPNGTRIDSYKGALADIDKMDCKCARTTLLLPKNSPEKPNCCENGNFNPVQQRRGKRYCVDENGYQNDSTECEVSNKRCLLNCESNNLR